MGKQTQRHIIHKINMALLKAEHWQAATEEASELRKDAEVMSYIIMPVYTNKRGAGALWLDTKLKNEDWLDAIHERAIASRREYALLNDEERLNLLIKD